MNVKIVSASGDQTLFDCTEVSSEFGFLVFKVEDNKEMFLSPAKISIMEITGRPKKKEEKKPAKTKKSVTI